MRREKTSKSRLRGERINVHRGKCIYVERWRKKSERKRGKEAEREFNGCSRISECECLIKIAYQGLRWFQSGGINRQSKERGR